MIDIDSIGVPPVFWMSGDTHMIDLDSKGAPVSILSGWGHSYARLRPNRGTTRYFGWVGTLI